MRKASRNGVVEPEVLQGPAAASPGGDVIAGNGEAFFALLGRAVRERVESQLARDAARTEARRRARTAKERAAQHERAVHRVEMLQEVYEALTGTPLDEARRGNLHGVGTIIDEAVKAAKGV